MRSILFDEKNLQIFLFVVGVITTHVSADDMDAAVLFLSAQSATEYRPRPLLKVYKTTPVPGSTDGRG